MIRFTGLVTIPQSKVPLPLEYTGVKECLNDLMEGQQL